jgi:hypothetical protein
VLFLTATRMVIIMIWNDIVDMCYMYWYPLYIMKLACLMFIYKCVNQMNVKDMQHLTCDLPKFDKAKVVVIIKFFPLNP